MVKSHIALVGALLLAGTIGYLVGRIVTVRSSAAELPIILREDLRPGESVVHVEGIRDGNVVGSLQGDARLILGTKQILPEEDGSFAVDAGPLLYNNITIVVPEGMRFVASERGTKYYPVDSASGERIAPQNRVYFHSEEEAQAEGYLP